MASPLSGWIWVDLGQKAIEVNGENAKVCAVIPIDGTVMEVRIGQTTLHASGGGTMTIYKQAGTVTANLLSAASIDPVSYTHLRAHEPVLELVCRLLLEHKNTRICM